MLWMLPDELDDSAAQDICNYLVQKALIQIRGTAHLRHHVGPSIGDGDYIEEIRLLADLCDGLAGPEPGAAMRLRYRMGVWTDDQARWAEETLSDR